MKCKYQGRMRVTVSAPMHVHEDLYNRRCDVGGRRALCNVR